jgi:hypothetical protein
MAGVFWVKRTKKTFSPLSFWLVNFLAQTLHPQLLVFVRSVR